MPSCASFAARRVTQASYGLELTSILAFVYSSEAKRALGLRAPIGFVASACGRSWQKIASSVRSLARRPRLVHNHVAVLSFRLLRN